MEATICFSTPDIPTASAPPPPPTREDASVTASQEEERRRAAQARGRQATILTGGLGDPQYGQNVRRTTLGAA